LKQNTASGGSGRASSARIASAPSRRWYFARRRHQLGDDRQPGRGEGGPVALQPQGGRAAVRVGADAGDAPVLGTAVGVLLRNVISNIVNQVGGLDSNIQSVTSGAFLLVVVVLQQVLSGRSVLRRRR
jgi:hypothetical protein